MVHFDCPNCGKYFASMSGKRTTVDGDVGCSVCTSVVFTEDLEQN